MVESRLVNRNAFLLAGMLVLGASVYGAARHHVALPPANNGVAWLELSTRELNLGDGKPDELLRGMFSLRNTGTTSTDFRLTPSCGCTELTPRQGTIAAGAEKAIQVGLKLPAIPDAERNARITIESEALGGDPLVCLVKARCPAPIRASPGSVNFGDFVTGRPASVEMLLDLQDAEGRPWTEPGRLTVTSPSPVLARLVATETGSVRLAVRLEQDGLQSDIHDAVTLAVDGSDLMVTVPVHARVVRPVRVAPSTVTLVRDPDTGSYRERQIILWSSDGMPLGELAPVKCANGITVVPDGSEATPPSRRLLRLRADATFDSTKRTFLTIVLPDRNETVKLAVHSGPQ